MRQNVTARVIFLILPKLLIYRLLHLLFYVHYSKFSCSCQAENVKAALESLLDPTRDDLPAALKRVLEQLRRPLQSVIGATGGAAAKGEEEEQSGYGLNGHFEEEGWE